VQVGHLPRLAPWLPSPGKDFSFSNKKAVQEKVGCKLNPLSSLVFSRHQLWKYVFSTLLEIQITEIRQDLDVDDVQARKAREAGCFLFCFSRNPTYFNALSYLNSRK
jgi:hypothetical protein